MDYTRNEDKLCGTLATGLYNTVLSRPVFSNESTTEPVSLDEAKDWCKIDLYYAGEDDIITFIIKAARRVCEQFVNLSYISRTVTASINNVNGNFYLPYGPVYGTPTATDSLGASVDVVYNQGLLKSPYGELIVTYGVVVNELDSELKAALKQQVLYMYEHRGESNVGISPMAQMILSPLRLL